MTLMCLFTLVFVSSSCKNDKDEGTPTISVSDTATVTFSQNDFSTTKEFEEAVKASTTNATEANDEVVLSIPNLGINTKVLEGTSDYVLSIAAGHVENTGAVGEGNYCIAGHTGTGGDFIFNELANITIGEKMYLISKEGVCYTYYVTEKFVVEPDEVWVLTGFGDTRLTLITCTEHGAKRLIVVGIQMTEDEYAEYVKKRDIQQIDDLRIYNSQYTNICITDYLDDWRK